MYHMGMIPEREVKEMKINLSEESDVNVRGFKKSQGKFIKNRHHTSKVRKTGTNGMANSTDHEIYWDNNDTTDRSQTSFSMERSSSDDEISRGSCHGNKSSNACRHCGVRAHQNNYGNPLYSSSNPFVRQRSCKRMKGNKGTCRNCHKNTSSRNGNYQIHRRMLADSLSEELAAKNVLETSRMKRFGGESSSSPHSMYPDTSPDANLVTSGVNSHRNKSLLYQSMRWLKYKEKRKLAMGHYPVVENSYIGTNPEKQESKQGE